MEINKGPLLVLIGALCFSTTGTSCALGMPEAGSLSITFVRSLGSAIILCLAASRTGGIRQFLPLSAWCSRAFLRVFVGLMGFQLLFFASLQYAGVTVATVVTMGMVPVSVGVLSALFLHQKPGRLWYTTTVLALTGVVCLGFARGAASGSATGILFAVAAGCSYGGFVIASRSMLAERSPAAIMTVFFIAAAVFLGCLAVAMPSQMDLSWLRTVGGQSGAAFLVLVGTVAAYIFTLRGFAVTPPPTAATLALGEPMGAAIWGIFILGEPVTFMGGLGIALLFVSMVLPVVCRAR